MQAGRDMSSNPNKNKIKSLYRLNLLHFGLSKRLIRIFIMLNKMESENA